MAASGEDTSAVAAPKTPADFLQSIKGKPVVVKLNSGVDYRGANTPLDESLSFKSLATIRAGRSSIVQLASARPDAHLNGHLEPHAFLLRPLPGFMEGEEGGGAAILSTMLRELMKMMNAAVASTGILACLDGYMNIAMEQTEVCGPSKCRVPLNLMPESLPQHPTHRWQHMAAAGVREWAAQEQVRRCVHPRQQRCVHCLELELPCASAAAMAVHA